MKGSIIVSGGMVKEMVGDEYVEYRYQDQEDGAASEGALAAGEDINTEAADGVMD